MSDNTPADGISPDHDPALAAVRRFSRLYTRQIGLPLPRPWFSLPMKLRLLLAVCLAGCASMQAQSIQDSVGALEKKRAAEVERATETVNRGYLKDYETLLQRANILGDAQGANLVRTVIRRLVPEPLATAKTEVKSDPIPDVKPVPDAIPAPDVKPGADPVPILTSNHWMEETIGENGRKHFLPMVFLPGGEMKSRDHGWSGSWKIEKNELVVEINAYPGVYRKYALPLQMKRWPGVTGKSTLTGSPITSSADTEAFLNDSKKPPEPAKPGPSGQPSYFGQ